VNTETLLTNFVLFFYNFFFLLFFSFSFRAFLQVYHARLRPEYALATGATEVAVKVRHPKVVPETFVDVGFIFQASADR
jgi:hypothetical protein